MNLEKDFEDFVVLLNKYQIRYMIVGVRTCFSRETKTYG
ncbi:MAG: hypothetical protein JWR50_1682 [Mucilaginibacter sp.]|nr:hypothetical protein [Mucilaginibacter sp.]